MGIMEKINENKTKEKNSFLLHGKHKKGAVRCRRLGFQILDRESVTSLLIFRRSDCRFTSGQEVKLFYATRATRGHRFYGVPTTPKGRDRFLLGLFFG